MNSILLGNSFPPASSSQPIHIVGAGIAGLLLGYYLKQRGISFLVYEKSNRPGGKLYTRQTAYGLAEGAANSVIRCTALDALVENLNLSWATPLDMAKKRYVVRGNVLHRFPLSFGEVAKGLINFIVPHTVKKPIVTVRDFVDQYLSPTVGSQLIEPGLLGIYAARLDELSLSAVMPYWAKVQQNYRSMAWGWLKNREVSVKRGGLASFDGGMQTLIDGLAAYLHKEIRYETDGVALLKGSDAPVVLCTNAFEAADWFGEHAIGGLLRQIRYLPMLSATFFVSQKALTRFKEGFGCVIPRNEGYQSMGILFNHCIFAGRTRQNDIASLTCIARDEDWVNHHADDVTVIAGLKEELERLLGLNEEPLHVELFRYQEGIPLYNSLLVETLPEVSRLLKRDFPSVNLLGNYTGQISVRGMAEGIAGLIPATVVR